MGNVIDWLQANYGVVSAMVTIATLLVWIVWLQLMYNDYRRRRQPRMLIHQTHGAGPESQCLLVNLSQEIIHIQCIRAAMIGEDEETSLPLGSPLSVDGDLGPREVENVLRQGPLAQGDFLRIGSFEEILELLLGQSPAEGEQWLGPTAVKGISTVEIRVVAVYGESDRSVGARRKFRLESQDDTVRVRAIDTYTEQLYSRQSRRIADSWLRQCLEE